MLKSLVGAVIIAADIFFGMAAPESFRALHAEHGHQAHSHLIGAYALYGILALLTLWVIVSAARTVSGGSKAAAPAPRTTYRYGSSQGRRS